MAKPLSEQLSELSVHAKNAEDALTAAQKEARDKIVARKEQARTAATAAVEKVNQEAKSVGDSACHSRKSHPWQIRAMRQNQRIIRRDACDPAPAHDVCR